MSALPQAFGEGLLDPVLVPAHALALVALGLLIGRQPSRGIALAVFAAALAGGLVAIALAVGATPARNVLLADAAVLGLLVATAWSPPEPVLWLLAAVAGVALALDSPPQAITIAQAHATLAGTLVGACTLLFAVSAVARRAVRPWQELGVRIIGSWLAASGILVLAVLLRWLLGGDAPG